MTEIEIVAIVCAVLAGGVGYLLFCVLRLAALEAAGMDEIASENRRAYQLQREKAGELL